MNIDKNYYQILGLDKNASPEEIKKTYRKLAIELHPDKNKGDVTKENQFKEVSEAYDCLGDVSKKTQYDTTSPNGKSYNPNPFSAFGVGGFGDIFTSFFGGGVPNSPFGPFGAQFEYREYHENLDITINVIVTLNDVYKSNPIKISYKRFLHCDDCQGTGFDRSSESFGCEMCGGRGRDQFGRKCEYCQGLGKIFSGTCKVCNGEKIVVKDTEFNLNNVHKIRQSSDEFLRGYGHQSKYYREKKGDLKLKVIYQDVKNYTVENEILYYNLDLHYDDAINGIKKEMELLDGSKILVSIPEKTNNSDVVRLKGKGLMIDHKDRGDLHIRINVMIDYERLQIQ